MKKVVSLFIVLSMLLTLLLPAFPVSAKAPAFPLVIVNLSDMGVTSKAGLKSSTEYSKSGPFTAVLEGNSLKKSTTFSVAESDLSGGEYIEFYMYSPIETSTALALALVSDNPSTSSLDYYYALVACNYQGWKHHSFRLLSLRTQGTPKGLNSVDKLMIIPGHGGSNVDPNAKFFIDDIVVTDKESEDANVEQSDKAELEPLVLWEAKEGGKNVVEIDGKFGYQIGPGEDALRTGGITVKPHEDMYKYRDLVIEAYSVKATNQTFTYTIYSPDNPETPSDDFYKGEFNINWQGEWKEIRFAISGGLKDYGDFNHSDSKKPLVKPYEGDKITAMYITSWMMASQQIYPDTTVYLSRVFLDGERSDKKVENPTGEIILPDRYDSSTMTDFASLVKAKHPKKHHPRLLVTDEILDRIKKYSDTDPFMKAAYNAVKKAADTYLDTPVDPPYKKDALGNEYVFNRTIEDVAKNCGLMYLFTGEEKYAERIWLEAQNMMASDIPWSGNSTQLDCGHIASGMALCYDWLYNWLDKDQKRSIRNAVMSYAFDHAIKIRDGGGYLNFKNNVVTAQSKGYVTAALAMIDEDGYENFCNELINRVVEHIPNNVLHQFVPDGNYGEGIGYWRYTIYSFSYMTHAMKTAAGTDAGLEELPGLRETCLLPFAMRGPNGAFNCADAGTEALREGDPVYFYLAERHNVPQLSAYRLETYEKYGGAKADDLFWYNPEKAAQLDWRENLPKDFILDGLETVASLRTGYDPDSIYLATKGGSHMTGHDHYDAGTFVLDANGVRWFTELGSEVYLTDFPRGYYYRVATQGHNCLFVDPSRNWAGQASGVNVYDTYSPIVASGTNPGSAYVVFNHQSAYKPVFDEYKRGFAFVNNRTQIIVRDEFKANAPYELYSYFHTAKGNEITIHPDGKSLTMKSKTGKFCKVSFVTDIPDLKLSVEEAVYHPSSVQPGPDNIKGSDNSGFQKIALHSKSVQKGTITMVITPMLEDREAPMPEILPLSDWEKYLEMNAFLTGISIDGIPLAEFDSGIGSYSFETEKVGVVSASADDNTEIEITQANAIGEAALIKATNKTTGNSFTYKVSFSKLDIPGVSTGVDFVSVDAQKISEKERPPYMMYDGDLSTRFTMEGYDGSCNFTVDLGSSRYLTSFSLSFYGGNGRKNKFTIELSDDKEKWTKVFDGFSPGDTDALLAYDITPYWGRYIRFTGWGCYEGDEETKISSWNSINEFVVNEEVVDFSDTKGHWAQSEILFSRVHRLVNGVGDNTYMPENSVTRAEFITMMVRACEFSQNMYEDGTYSDVKKTEWYANNIMTAKEKGIIPSEMIKDGKFRPDKQLTREEMCAIAVLAYTASTRRSAPEAGTTSVFKDLSEGPYLPYVDKAIGLRITNGMSADTFAPGANITRAQAAAILRRVYLKIFNTVN